MVVTGASSGIGLAIATALCAKGIDVIGVGRSPERCDQATASIAAAVPGAGIAFEIADLSSQTQVRELAARLRMRLGAAYSGQLAALINNAGAIANWYTATEDGYELQFALNHLATFLLTLELLPNLASGAPARVVTVSSASHRNTRIHWKDVMLRRNYNTLLAYKQSKLANVMFTAEFNRRHAASGVRAYAADPGLVNTEIGMKGTSGIVAWFWDRRRRGGKSPEYGAATAVHLATDPSVASFPGIYWKDSRPKAPSAYALREAEASRLWELSERLCGIGE
ncbi:MAG: SDR family NAD(P)-dependent oxidoreductase [Anaerolineae bacterium]|nr:SDR family NAD(P)-dependent oxidoreductase [Anaerolineae bacterium]